MMTAADLEQAILTELDFDEPQLCESQHLGRNHLCSIDAAAVASHCRRPVPFYVCRRWVEYSAHKTTGRSRCICGKLIRDCWTITPLNH